MNSKLPITLVMVVHHEEKIIAKALASVAPLVSEIIVIHDGKCKDQTGKIVKKFRGKFIETEFIGEAERHRVLSYQLARYDWVIQLDADEVLSGELASVLPKMLTSGADMCTVNWSIIDQGKTFANGYHRQFLFRKPKFFFIACPHEFMRPTNQRVVFKHFEQNLIHAPARDQYARATIIGKTKKWAPIHARALKNWDQLEKFNYSKQQLPFLTINNLLQPTRYPPLALLFNGLILIPSMLIIQGLLWFFRYRWSLGLLVRKIYYDIYYHWTLTIKLLTVKPDKRDDCISG